MKTTTLKQFGLIAIAEGISFLLLLLIAMPIKYFGNKELGDQLVRYIGMAHGVLFVLYALLLLFCLIQYRWKIGKAVIYFFLSFVPFGTFWVDKKVKEEIRSLEGKAKAVH